MRTRRIKEIFGIEYIGEKLKIFHILPSGLVRWTTARGSNYLIVYHPRDIKTFSLNML